jgi:hypothetical protein
VSKIIGVKIDSKSDKYKDKIYYYKTDNDNIKRGDVFRAEMKTGGTPNVYVAIGDSNKKVSNLKEIKEK